MVLQEPAGLLNLKPLKTTNPLNPYGIIGITPLFKTLWHSE